jgi:hypothetical protein
MISYSNEKRQTAEKIELECSAIIIESRQSRRARERAETKEAKQKKKKKKDLLLK